MPSSLTARPERIQTLHAGTIDALLLIRISTGTAKADKAEPTTTSGGNENQPQSITAGEVVVDAFDRSTGQQVWHGTARAEIDPQRVNEPLLQAAMKQMMTPFPAHLVQP